MRKRLCFILFALSVAFVAMAQNDTVIFSASGGFYEDAFQLELFNYYPQHHIRYTTNGNKPTAESPLYEESLMLDEHLYSNADIYTVINCPEQDFYLPDSVQHCIVIRAAAFDENDSCVSSVMTHSYFIRALGCDTHGLPAVSLCADSLDLFDYETGIFVPGVYYDPLNPNWTGNYYEEGREWERPMNIEFYELDNTGINQQAGMRTHGGNGRRFQQKCVKIYAREEYGKKRFKHNFFKTIPNNNFKHLVLKPFAASWHQSGVNDHICNQIASRLDLETLASRPVVLFLNGEYWGIYYIHERPDERYLEDHFGVDINNINLISGWNPIVDHGSVENFSALFQWMEMADLVDADNYAFVSTQMDLDNFIDYQIFELFSENTDWPANNMRCWQLGDGKWRWIFFDGDACLRWSSFYAFENAVYEGNETWPSHWRATLFFRKLLENDIFKERFDARFHELLGTAFNYETTRPIFDSIRADIIDEIPLQSDRFNFPTSMEAWNDDMGRVNWFLMKRGDDILEPLDAFLELPEYQDALLCYPNPSSGVIHLCFDTGILGEIAIYDLMGRKVFSRSIDGMNEISINPSLPAGVYVLRIGGHMQRIVRL